MHKIQNNFLSIAVKQTGAELCSIKDLKSQKEYIWQGEPSIWANHSPVLFPIVGALKNGKYYYEEREYSLPKHGFVRYNENVTLREKTEQSLTFVLKYSEETLKIYPFKFELEIVFILKDKQLKVLHRITNLDKKSLYFSLGAHPAFNAPLNPGESYEDYYLEFDRKLDLNSCLLNDEGLISDNTREVTKNGSKIRLHENLFDNDALIFKKIPSKKVTLKSEKSGSILTVDYKDFPNLGIWAKPDAPFVCIEPWLGITDLEGTNQDIKTKEGINSIMPSQKFEASYSISIE